MENYPEETVQSLVGSWWEQTDHNRLCRGRLIWAYFRFVDLVPQTLTPVGRSSATEHDGARFRLSPLRVHARPSREPLPVAALPSFEGQEYLVQQAKRRPGVVLAELGAEVSARFPRGSSRWIKNRTIVAAPYYSAELNRKSAGWPTQLVQEIQQGRYRQYFWDQLPMSPKRISVLRFDHIQALGAHHDAVDATNWALTEDALEIFTDWFDWYIHGGIASDTLLQMFVESSA